MAKAIGALHADMSAGHAKFAADMGKARQALTSNASRMQRAMNRVGGAFKSAFGFAQRWGKYAVAAGAAGFVMMMRNAINTADEIGKMSQSIGMTTERLSTLKYAADLSGATLNDLATGMRRFAANAGDAARGTGEALEGFQELGIELRHANGDMKEQDELLYEIADRFASLPDGLDKTRYAMDLFGRSGTQLIPMLNQGADGMREMEAEARKFGAEISSNAAVQAELFNDNLTRLKTNVTGLSMAVATWGVPKLNEIAEAMKEAAKEGTLLDVVWSGLKYAIGLDELSVAEARLKNLLELQKQGASIPGSGWVGIDSALYKRVSDQMWEVYQLRLKQQEAEKKRLAAAREAREAETQAAAERSQQLQAEIAATTRLAQEKADAAAAAAAREAAELRRQKRGEAIIEGLEREIALLGDKTALDEMVYDLEKGQLSDLEEDQKQIILQLTRMLEKKRALLEEPDKVPFEKTREGLRDLRDEGVDTYDTLNNAVDGWASNATSALADFATSGELSFKRFADAIIRDMIRIQLQTEMTTLFRSAWGALAPSGGGGGAGGGYGGGRPDPVSSITAKAANLSRDLSEPTAKLAGGQSVRVVNVLDPSVVNDWAASPAGERTILNTIAKNRTQVRQTLD